MILQLGMLKKLKLLAKSVLDERLMGHVYCTGECVGIPEIEPGKFMEVGKLDTSINGKYYITRVKHVLDEAGYFTKFELKGNSI